ncbi:DUF692 family protein [Streptosporangiaceae bacterium NEAU-GS5]|nr:DUF692 family protein [Streptosporangiaceae bacterium NEAU-GS5]
MSGLGDLLALPELGVGVVYWPGWESLLEWVDVVEVEPQAFWLPADSDGGPHRLDERAFERLGRIARPKLVHGVGYPVGGTAPDQRHLEPFVESVGRLAPAWVSEHLSFNRLHDTDLGFLLPPVQSEEGVMLAAANIARLKERLPVPFAFETGVSYLRPTPGELTDGAYFAAVARAADCGILLDMHNLWANERNGRQAVADVLAALPLERIVEVHLAGGAEYAGYWLDAHSGLVPAEVMDLARQMIPRLPNLKAVVYEVMPESVADQGLSVERLGEQLLQLRDLWDSRGSAAARPLPSPARWEERLGAALLGRERPLEDPGVGVLRKLIGSVRAGNVAGTLPLTTRLLLMTLGGPAVEDLLADFWATAPPEPMAADEARCFAAHLAQADLPVRHLREVVGFELAAQRAILTGLPQRLTFPVDPRPLIGALREGRLPGEAAPGTIEITVTPPGV